MTDYSTFYKRFIDAVYCTPQAAEFPAARRAAERLLDSPFRIIASRDDIPAAARTGRTLFLAAGRGSPVGPCPGSAGHLCCDYFTIDLYEGCPIGCTYCILQSYLNSPVITVNVDTGSIIDQIKRLIAKHPGRPLRLGTGEVGDSLFFDPLFELSRDLVEACARLPEAVLELKTKTDFVDHLLPIREKGSAVIGFSLNPPGIAAAEEKEAAGLEARLAAARRARDAGFRIAFHFDPVIRTRDWERRYGDLIARLAEFGGGPGGAPAGPIAWISLGTLRYPKALADKLNDRPYFYDEFALSRDRKYRYLRPMREDMYRFLLDRLRRLTGAPVYLCMESPAVWEKVFGNLPSKIGELCVIFSTERFNRRQAPQSGDPTGKRHSAEKTDSFER